MEDHSWRPAQVRGKKKGTETLSQKQTGLGAGGSTPVILDMGKDQEDHGSKPAQVNSLQDPISK
jgi:hypothetical protein